MVEVDKGCLMIRMGVSGLMFFFWYRPTQVVPDKTPLNGCVCVCVNFQIISTVAMLLERHFICQGYLCMDKTSSFVFLYFDSIALFSICNPFSVPLMGTV